MSEDFGTRLSRWSQRKQAARRGVAPDEAGEERRPEAPAEPPVAAVPAEAPPADVAAEEAPVLPPIEELTAESDYTAFLGQNVPETLKRAALRKLWRSDPVLANLDGLNDYDDDYNAVETLVETVRSAYRAGRGYVDEAEEKLARLESDGSDEPVEDAESPPGGHVRAKLAGSAEKNNQPGVDGGDAAARQVATEQEASDGADALPHKPI